MGDSNKENCDSTRNNLDSNFSSPDKLSHGGGGGGHVLGQRDSNQSDVSGQEVGNGGPLLCTDRLGHELDL
jgi:hypothetical protein